MTSTPKGATAPEFPRPVRVDDLDEDEAREIVLSATEDERRALVARFGLADLARFEARCVLRRSGETVQAELTLSAEVVQSCVVTLDPVPARIEATVAVAFAAAARRLERVVDVDIDADDPPEPIIGNAIELGEAVAEAFGVALDPYPRSPGAAFDGWSDQGEGGRENPFSVLARLKR